MKSVRFATFALMTSAIVFILAGCGKSSDFVAPATVLDTTPPAAPTDVAGSFDPASQRDYLNWTGSTSPDVAGYEVWQYESDPALGATGVLVASTDASTDYVALPLTNQAREAWFRVRANDEAGNMSAFSASASHELHAWEDVPAGNGGPLREGAK